ncbi:LytTR family transcriptional regulator DNA-binding domain-containing protein [Ornithinibacillus bavariensis]|uniref:LytTR family transcriptional regulator DNA-binding domain-containing protein n=1 Tax=Ornithinibacillus bavariensis TaxID=545502 RepID=UPI000EDC7ABB|nr:ABC transporter ATP-binding protein [Ornithinibacillus sp.]
MNVLSIQNLEKQEKDVLLFPSFSLHVGKGEVSAIYSNINIRKALLNMFLGKEEIYNGDIEILGEKMKDNPLYRHRVGFCFFEQHFYERLTILDNIRFVKRLYDSKQIIDDIINITQLGSIKNNRVSKLSFSEKKRLQIALLLVQDPALYIFEEPDLNIDMESKRVLLNILQALKKEGKAVLILTGIMESAITLAGHIFRLDENGLHQVEEAVEVESGVEEAEEEEKKEDSPITFNLNKVPTKVNDKIILFDPTEIDYIESNDGVSSVFTKGESFPSVFTMNELEERLKPFGFFRCHRSYIVNLQKVREVITWTRNSFSLVLDDKPKSTIPLSKTKMTQLKELLGLK